MISKLPHILIIFITGCMTMISQGASAQDGYPQSNFQEPSYQELNLNEDKPLIYELNENRSSRTTVNNSQRDSVSTLSAKAKAAKKTATEKKDDDALSFNFLYYIIQKYKASDIVDQ